MKRSIFTILFVAISLSVLTASPRLSRSQLKNATIITDNFGNLQPAASPGSSVTPVSPGQESQLDLNNNRLDGQSLQAGFFMGSKIASAQLYNSDWDAESGTATVHSSSCASIGSLCNISLSINRPGFYLTSFFGEFRIPIDIDTITGGVTIKAGEELCGLTDNGEIEPVKMNASSALTDAPPHFWRLYAMPLSWLTGDDDYDDIHGQLQEDGTITFNDDFAFLVKKSYQGETSWGLSLIYTNLKLLVPNGRHVFRYKHYEEDDFIIPGTEGHGGLVPRNPGQTRPVTPRPFVPINSAGPRHEDTPGIKTKVVYSDETAPVYIYNDGSTLTVYNLFGLGYRCRIHTNQQNGSISLRSQIIYYNGPDSLSRISYDYASPSTGTWAQDTIKWSGTVMCDAHGNSMQRSFLDNRLFYSDGFTLFGILEPEFYNPEMSDSMMVFSATTSSLDGVAQLYRYDEDAQSYYQVENPLTVPRLSEPYWVSLAACTYDTIRCQYSSMVYKEYKVPALGTEPQMPVFAKPIITDTTVTFHATTVESDSIEIHLYMSDEQESNYIEVDNPLSVPRLDAPYWVDLVAVAYNPIEELYSYANEYYFEVPQLGLSCLPGDANADGEVNITDAIVLINALLNDDFEPIYYFNADVNWDGDITITDAIALINYLLSGQW